MRIVEAFFACILILSTYSFVSFYSSTISGVKREELDTMVQNMLVTLENQQLLISITENDPNWQYEIKDILNNILPPDILYNITFKSLISNATYGDAITNIMYNDNGTQYNLASANGLYTLSYPMLQKTDILLDVTMVMDRSGSMSWELEGDPQPKIYYTKLAATNFIDRLNMTTDRVGLTSFGTDSRIDAYLTFDHAYAKSKVNALNPNGWTNMEGGINKANTIFSGYGRDNATWVMIVLSDGVANWWDGNPGPYNEVLGCRYAAEKAEITKDLGVKIYTIGLGDPSYLNETLLREIQTNGYYFAPSAQDLDSIYQAIAEDLIFEVRYDVILIQITLMKPIGG